MFMLAVEITAVADSGLVTVKTPTGAIVADLPVSLSMSGGAVAQFLPRPGDIVFFCRDDAGFEFIQPAQFTESVPIPVKQYGFSFSDGVSIVYDPETKKLKIDGNVSVEVSGKITVSGGDVIADGISLKNHTHAAATGVPPLTVTVSGAQIPVAGNTGKAQ